MERDTFDLDPSDLIEFAGRWADLGGTITSQVSRLMETGDATELNPNALRRALEALEGFNEQLDDALREALAEGE